MAVCRESIVSTRAMQPEDADHILRLYLDRKADGEPGYPENTRERTKWFIEHGEWYFGCAAEDAQLYPDRYYAEVATVDTEVVGLAMADSLPSYDHTWWCGLYVARSVEGQGVARRLEASRQRWAYDMNRTVRAPIVRGNERSLAFFNSQGFQLVEVSCSTKGNPMTFYIMELGIAALKTNVENCPQDV